jgi:uncharacterized membrane protein
MRVFGHPVHPLLIHFPTALLPMDLVMSVLYLQTENESYYHAGFYCLCGAAITGIIAMIAGLLDLYNVPKSDTKALTVALYHGFINGLIILTFAIIALKCWQKFPSAYFADKTGVIVKAILVFVLFIGNYLGGRLIYNHHIGIVKKDGVSDRR